MNIESLIALGFKKATNKYDNRLYLFIPNSDAFFIYDDRNNLLQLLSSDSGDTSMVVKQIDSIERIKELYKAVSGEQLK